jgi:Holliday junction resolvasome RuvABC endonuclease subunit
MRFYRFVEELNRLWILETPHAIYYEEVHAHAGTDAAHAYGGFRGMLMYWCEAQEPSIPYGSFGVGTIKKRATGKGNAKKPDMIAAANRVFGPILMREIADDNEADALWILALALDKHDISLDTE